MIAKRVIGCAQFVSKFYVSKNCIIMGNKKRNGLHIMWIPSGSRHKYKKSKYYIRDNYNTKRFEGTLFQNIEKYLRNVKCFFKKLSAYTSRIKNYVETIPVGWIKIANRFSSIPSILNFETNFDFKRAFVSHYPGVGDIYKCVVGVLSFLSIERIPSTADIFSAMMSGDSPNSHTKDYFDIKEGRSTPPPTTSKDIAVQSSSGGGGEAKAELLAASVILEPVKESLHNYVSVTDTQSINKNENEIIAQEDKPPNAENCINQKDKKKINSNTQKIDGSWPLTSDKKKEEEDNDENCAVKCLYYTLQCCECNIM